MITSYNGPVTHYTAGFAFSPNRDHVALIEKKRPQWQAGLLNAIGGHVEEDETAHACQVREFCEETGLLVPTWEMFTSLRFPKAQVDFFVALVPNLVEASTMTDEDVHIVSLRMFPQLNTIPNIKWLVPMALDYLDRPSMRVITEF